MSSEDPIDGGAIQTKMAQVLSQIKTGATTEFNILFVGDTGLVAEHLARTAHDMSRRTGEFVAINCDSLSETVIEKLPDDKRTEALQQLIKEFDSMIIMADDGTLFLDKVDRIGMIFQNRISDMLDAKGRKGPIKVWGESQEPVNVRVIAATQEDLPALMDAGRFLEKLVYHLDEIYVDLRGVRDILSEAMLPYIQALIRKSGH